MALEIGQELRDHLPAFDDDEILGVAVLGGLREVETAGEHRRPGGAGIDDDQQGPYLHAFGVLVQSKMLIPADQNSPEGSTAS